MNKTKKEFVKIVSVLFLFLTLALLLSRSPALLTAEPNCDNPGSGDIDVCLERIQRDIDALTPAQEYNKKELDNLRNQINNFNKRITALSTELVRTEKAIKIKGEDLGYAQAIYQEKTTNYYKYLRLYDSLLPFLFSKDAVSFFREVNLRKKAVGEDVNTIEKYASEIISLKTDKEKLEKNKVQLTALKAKVDEREAFLAKEVAKTENYLSSLSAKQNELLAMKAGGFQTSVGDTPPTLEPCSGAPGSGNFCDPGFRPAFALFSFGAPHRTGMSQYGAYGRSKSGQSAETILAAYFQGTELRKDYPIPSTIGVQGIGRVSFEENYLLGIYEVPESWGDNGGFEALKAQAVAARSYALAVTNNGAGTICTTEACQVYKRQLKTGKWAEAVRATRGWVLTKGGTPAKAYFASTAGGYTITNWGWEGIKDVSGDWPGGAYEKISASPWFYKGWYKTRSGTTCGRSNPWLKGEELADILNAWMVVYKGVGDISRISPLDTACWKGNPYSITELQNLGGYNSVNSVSVVYSNSGFTQSLNFSTNKGDIQLSGEEFKKAFNLRAPGYIGIKSSLYNIEKL